MRELVHRLDQHAEATGNWVWKIMQCIDVPTLRSTRAFSEYQTYGHFVSLHHREAIAYRELAHLRFGAARFGRHPTKYDLRRLARTYTYVSFERWNVGPWHTILREHLSSFLAYGMRRSGRLT